MNNKIAVLFPGMGYGKDKPLLYYAARQLQEFGYEIRYTDYEGTPAMAGVSLKDKQTWTQAAYKIASEQLADIDWEDKDVVFIAKSVGTIIASFYATEHDLHPVMLLLTPVDETFEFLCDGENYIFTGDNDPYIDICKHSDMISEKVAGCVLFEDANHSLETGVVDEDLETLWSVIERIQNIFYDEEP